MAVSGNSYNVPYGRPSLQGISPWIFNDAEVGAIRFPDVLLITIMLGGNDNDVRNQIRGIKANAKLTDHIIHVLSACGILHFSQKLGCAGFRDGSEIVH